MKTNNFEQAILWMAQGKKVCNSLWAERAKANPITPIYIWANEQMNSFAMMNGNGVIGSRFYMSPAEMIYGEWQIYEGEEFVKTMITKIRSILVEVLDADPEIKDLDAICNYLIRHGIKTRKDLAK